MKISTVHVVRHGQTTWNAAGRIQGQSDSELSELGRAQADKVAAAIAARPLAALYTSDLKRARQTAAPLAAATQLVPIARSSLRERHYGELETLTWPEVLERFPDMHAALRAGDPKVRLPGGESREDLVARIVPAFDAIADTHGDEEVCVVTHGGVLAAFFGHVLGLDPGRRPPIRTLNGAISTFERWGDSWKLITFGAAAHLGDLVSARPPPGTMSTA